MIRIAARIGSWFSYACNEAWIRSMLIFRAAWRAVFRVARCDVAGIPITIAISTPNEHHRADTYVTKEPETLEWLRQNLRDGDVLYDVGANIGRLLLNRATNVTPCCFPLSDREAFEPFHVYDLRPGGALHSLGAPSSFRDEPPMATYGALSVTIDALVARYRLPPPTLMKLDVDGIEERILGGAGAVLASGALRTILVEVTCRASGEIPWAESKLAPHGYRLAGRSDWSVELYGLRSQNFIFTRRP